jgi:signal transduction histidine kinase
MLSGNENVHVKKLTGQGTGSGLSLSYEMATHIHGGKLHVETGEGEYAAFIIRLPD